MAGHMVWIPAGDFLMGSEDFYPEERPVSLDDFRAWWSWDVTGNVWEWTCQEFTSSHAEAAEGTTGSCAAGHRGVNARPPRVRLCSTARP